jgi:S-adenosylmethionine hydrolase
MPDPIITLTTDFGLRDPYAAAMKGVLLRHCPEARILDLSHEIAPQDLVGAALFAEAAMPWFPENTIHLVVVDPGVGTARRPIAARAGGQVFVFPDNGLLTLLFRRLPVGEAHVIAQCPFIPEEVSRTFHGRDVFAPAAAWIALDHPLDTLGPPMEHLVELPLPGHKVKADGSVCGEVIHIDRFGNCVTSIPAALFSDATVSRSAVVQNGARTLPLRGTYADVARGTALAVSGSAGRIEIAVRNGNAAVTLGLRCGDNVRII